MEQTDSRAHAGSYDKSRVLDVKPLRCLAPMFPSPPLGSQSAPNFVYAPPFGPFPPGCSSFYPFFNPSESSRPSDQTYPQSGDRVPNHGGVPGYGDPHIQTPPVPLNSFRTPPPPPAFGADAGSSRKRAVNLEGSTQSGRSVSEDDFHSGANHSGGTDLGSVGVVGSSNGVKKRARQKREKVSSDVKYFSPADGDQDSVRDLLLKFDALRRRLSQIDDAKDKDSNVGGGGRRPDLKSGAMMMSKGLRTNTRRRVGNVPGVEIGDIFFFRIEMCLVGLHAPSMAGIDYMTIKFGQEEETVAVSIVSAGGYGDEMGDADMLVYSGQGGIKRDVNEVTDQKLERGNLALERSLRKGNEVRVIRGVKDPWNSTGKIYFYDGLFKIQESWMEKGKAGAQVFKYRLYRLPGQIEGFAVWKAVQQWKENPALRPGLILPDLTSGAEKLPVSLVNDVDDEKGPAHFSYFPTLQYPKPINSLKPAFGCHCQGSCVPGNPNCSCVMKNGGDFPHTNNGILASRKSLIYECGPSCGCYPNCKNQVSQNGLRIRLEVYKTMDKGWGLRSWDPIRAGSFICEFAGQVIHKTEGDGIEDDDDYVLDTGCAFDNSLEWNYMPELLGEDRSDHLNDMQNSPVSVVISAKKIGNVARFMNHSCTPNVLWQPVLYEHDDESYPHIMFYAMKHIPPMTELTYDYGLSGTDSSSASPKRKKCLCHSLRCRGYFG
ncbi:hypothetical protein Scep_003125 [Stephania cephalantha]|uniref:Histone-lysine N-methyltransferase n=1 Tax=Stephania cephalantha TaxID=152367 RepID=A0AAP0PXR5_9MAGN